MSALHSPVCEHHELLKDVHLRRLRLAQLVADARHCARVRESDGRLYSTFARFDGSHRSLMFRSEIESSEAALVKSWKLAIRKYKDMPFETVD